MPVRLMAPGVGSLVLVVFIFKLSPRLDLRRERLYRKVCE
jgi:hypothetical protein